MRSLTWKLTLTILLVGVGGILLFSLLLGLRTRQEFDRFLSVRDQDALVEALAGYYAANSSWAGAAEALAADPRLEFAARSLVLADANGSVIQSPPHLRAGRLSAAQRDEAAAITVAGRTVGYLSFDVPNARRSDRRPVSPPEADFLRRIGSAMIASALLTALPALLLGLILARTLTRPLTELTAATRAMAAGDLHQQVVVRSQDEIGELATAFNQMSADLARASHLRKQMTADLAHDLRTPLTILRGYTQGLQEARIQGAPPLYTLMHDEVVHLQRLVEDLRILSLADAGELPLNRRPVDPRALIERAGLAYIVVAEQQGVALRLEPGDEPLPSVSVDTDRMAQVLNNLVSNALRHTSQGEIVLSAEQQAGRVALQVRDTGAGIQPDDLPYVFDRFYRGDKSRARSDDSPARESSSGLGLAIAKAIVEAHGGSIHVASTPGRGSTFTITLPAA